MTNIKNSFLIFFFPVILFSNQGVFEWSSMTSLINATDIIKDSNKNILASTNGGIISIEDNQLNILKDNLNNFDLSFIGLDSHGLIWVAGTYPHGNIQVFDSEYQSVYNSDYLEIDSIIDIVFNDTKVFAIYTEDNEIGILEFNYDENIPYYLDYYNSFPESINSISDIDLFENNIFITTDKGIFSSNFILNNLKLSSSWIQPVYFNDDTEILFFHQNDSGIFLTTDHALYLNQNNYSELILEFENTPIDIESNEEQLLFCTIKDCYKFDGEINLVYSSDDYLINNYYIDDNTLFLAIHNGGVCSISLDNSFDSQYFIPNTLLQNRYDAITLLDNGNLAGISETNGFIYDGDTFKYFIPSEYENLFPVSLLDEYMNNGNIEIQILNYKRGDKMIWSIIENNNGNIMFNNSGIKPDIENSKGGIIELNPYNFNLTLYDTSKTNYMESIDFPIGVLDGLYGISDENTFDQYMVVHQLNKDNQGNIWAMTPYSEKFNHIASVQIYNNTEKWMHIFSEDNTSYLPTEIAFDKYNRGWVGFQNSNTWNNSSIDDFSDGGIKAFYHNDYIYSSSVQDSSDVVWLELSNLEDLPNGINTTIWSLDIGSLDNQEILWVLSPQGAQGYILNNLELIEIYPIVYYSNLAFQQGDKIRIDAQDNAWISTRHSGVRVIKNNATLWPNGDGFTRSNSSLLSDFVYDISFDNQKGIVYLATEKGISILNVPFSEENNDLENLYVTPQPFIISGQGEKLIIKKLMSGSNIKIISLNGYVINEYNLDDNENILYWDGRDSKNNLLSTGVYYLVNYKDGKTITKKIAIVRK